MWYIKTTETVTFEGREIYIMTSFLVFTESDEAAEVFSEFISFFLCFSVSPPEELQPKKQSIASRLSEKFCSSPFADSETNDFQPDSKRIRTAEPKVPFEAFCSWLYKRDYIFSPYHEQLFASLYNTVHHITWRQVHVTVL